MCESVSELVCERSRYVFFLGGDVEDLSKATDTVNQDQFWQQVTNDLMTGMSEVNCKKYENYLAVPDDHVC